MKALLFSVVLLCSLGLCNFKTSENIIPDKSTGQKKILTGDSIIHHKDFPSDYLDSRNVEVWIPNGYSANSKTGYKVLYIHDGQNVFNDKTAYGNVEWGIDETLDSLIANNLVAPTIVVAIWNNGQKRFPEYMPQIPGDFTSTRQAKAILKENFGVTELLSNRYLQFIVEELKPFIDSTYNTSPLKEDTAIMGSSMGGLISLYAISSYPEVFGAAGCVSTHWPVPLIGQAYIQSLASTLPDPEDHRIYFDYGTETLDAEYEPYQKLVDEIMRNKGYEQGINWITRKFEGAAHNEESWKKRAHIPLVFLLQ